MTDPPLSPEGYVRRTALYPPEQWNMARRAAALITARTGRDVSINELQRWGLHLVLKRVEQGELEPPADYEDSTQGGE